MPNFFEIACTAAEIWRFVIFLRWRPSAILDLCVGTIHEGHLMVFVTVHNLVGIDAVVLIICTFFDFASLASRPKIILGV